MPLPEATPGTVDALAVGMLRDVCAHDPVLATDLGVHDHDGELPEATADSLDEHDRCLRGWRDRIASTEPPAAEAIDHRGLLAAIDSLLASASLLRPWQRNPSHAPSTAISGIMLLIVWDHLPREHRERALRSRCRALGAFLGRARDRLDPEQVPPLWVRMAERGARGGASLLRETLPVAFPELAGDAEAAAREMDAHAAWLAGELAPAARGDHPVGARGLEHLLARVHLLDEGPAAVRARGEELMERHEALLTDAAGGQDWREALARVRADHPAHGDLVPAYREELERLRRFCFEADLVTDPRAPAVLEATPEFLRPVMGYAAYLPPAALGGAGGGKLWVTPPDGQEGLADHSRGAMQPITAHEGYPGHHLQMTSVVRLPSVVRRLTFASQLMIEGWGLYVEELMHEAGYYDAGGRLAQLSLSQMRACRIVVDMGLHTGEMRVEEAEDLLVDRAGISRATARSEVQRYTMTPTQPFSYLYGAEEIRRIRDAYRRRTGAGLRRFHDALLAFGHLPPSLAAEALLDGDG